MRAIKTKNYDRFGHISGNRGINKNHLRSLMQSIQEENLLEEYPILVDAEMNIIDGQHRLEAAKSLDIDIYYKKLDKVATLGMVQRININSRKWTMEDFIRSHIELGNPHYKILQEFKKMNQISYAKATAYLSGRDYGHEVVKRGGFKVKSVELGQECVDLEEAILPYTEESKYGAGRDLTRAIHFFIYNKFSSERLIKKFSMYPAKMPRYGSKEQYLRAIEDRYNYHARESIRIF